MLPSTNLAAMMSAGAPAGMLPMPRPVGFDDSPEVSAGVPSAPLAEDCGPIPSKEEVVQGLWEASAGRADLRFIKTWAENSGETADWLIDMADEQGIQITVGRFSHFFSRPGISPLCLDRTPVGCREADENDGLLLHRRVVRPHPPAQAPNASALAERFLRTVRQECLDHNILVFGVRHLERILRENVRHYNRERPHCGLSLETPESQPAMNLTEGEAVRVARLGGLIKEYHRIAS
jgi:hypothetical protein